MSHRRLSGDHHDNTNTGIGTGASSTSTGNNNNNKNNTMIESTSTNNNNNTITIPKIETKSLPFSPLEIEIETEEKKPTITIDSNTNDDNDNDNDYDRELINPLVTHQDDYSDYSKGLGKGQSSTGSVHTTGGTVVGSASTIQVIINIIISFIGAGLLGIPNAFSKSGWLVGSITLLCVSALNVYAMLCLPQVQKVLQKRFPHEIIQSYGDLGRLILGPKGEKVVFLCLGISQAGFATAYIIFIAANLHSIFLWSRFLVCLLCVPGLLGLVQFTELKSLSYFSMIANTANFCALSAVLFQDYEQYTPHNDTIHKWSGNIQGFIYVIAITIYSMEGVGLVLSLKSSCSPNNTTDFTYLLISTLTVISIFMVVFGSAGYWAFGIATEAPITLNMTSHWSATFVKCALCVGLYLTYPIMMFPIWTIIESPTTASTLSPPTSTVGTTSATSTSTPAATTTSRTISNRSRRIMGRSGIVCCSAVIAYAVPNFGQFLALVGSSICTLLGFVFPSYFHLYTFGHELPTYQKILDCFLLVGGLLFGCFGTYQSVVAMIHGELEGE